MNAAIYGRVSTVKQDYAHQVDEMEKFAGRMEWQPLPYLEKESAKAGSNRPMLKKLLEDAAQRRFDVVLAYRIDRFGRSVAEFSQNVLALKAMGIRFIATSQSIDTDDRNPMAKMMMHLLAIFAEFELDMIHERVQEGVTNYQALYKAGKVGAGRQRQSKSGKNLPIGKPRKIFPIGQARELRAAGKSWGEISKTLGVKSSTIRGALKRAA